MIPILTVFYVKCLFSIASSIGILWLVSKKGRAQLSKKNWNDKNIIGICFLIFRIIPFVVVYLVLDQAPRGDVPFFWYKTTAVLKGGMVYKDFWSYHAPLFSYLITLPIVFWYNSKAIVLFMVIVEGLILFYTTHYSKKTNPDALLRAVVYLMLSAPLIMVVLGGQEDVWFWGLTLIMLFYFREAKNDGLLFGVIYALGLVAIKVTWILWLFPILIFIRKKVAFLVGMALVGIPTLLIVYGLVQMRFLMPIEHTAQPMSPNLFSVLMPFLEELNNHAAINWAGLGLCIVLSLWLGYRSRKTAIEQALPLSFIWTFASMNIFQLSAMGYYAFVYLMPFVFFVLDLSSKRDIVLLLAFNLLLVVEPFLYTYLQNPIFASFSVVFKTPLHTLQYLLQILNLIGFVWVIFKTQRVFQGNVFLKVLLKTN